MATSKKGQGPSKDDLTKLTFEEAFSQLQAVVQQLESPDLPLDTLIERFELGIKLLQICRTKLSQAEIRIKQLEADLQGNLKIKPIDPMTLENNQLIPNQ